MEVKGVGGEPCEGGVQADEGGAGSVRCTRKSGRSSKSSSVNRSKAKYTLLCGTRYWPFMHTLRRYIDLQIFVVHFPWVMHTCRTMIPPVLVGLTVLLRMYITPQPFLDPSKGYYFFLYNT